MGGLTARLLLDGIEADGGRIVTSPDGRIGVDGAKDVRERWLPRVRELRAELLALLAAAHAPQAATPAQAEPRPITGSPAEPAPFTAEERAAVVRWLDAIGETDEALRQTCLRQCETDAEARVAFLRDAGAPAAAGCTARDRAIAMLAADPALDRGRVRGRLGRSRARHPTDDGERRSPEWDGARAYARRPQR